MSERPPSFIDLFCYAQGRSNTPPQFFFWSGISLVAACVADRVWLQRFAAAADRRTFPNLYVLLVAPSAVGKGAAIKEAAAIGRNTVGDRLYFGRLTAEGLRDVLKTEPTTWLLNEELAFSVHQGPPAFDFITALVGLFDGGNLPPVRDRTRTRGEIKIDGACVNWLAGTTPDWLGKTFDMAGFAGGFSRRILVVRGDYLPVLLPEPLYPPDREAVQDELRRRCAGLAALEGPMSLEVEADALYRDWFSARPMPESEELRPWWTTEDELVFKLSMVFALSDGTMTVERRHMLKAQQEADARIVDLRDAIRHTSTTPDATDLNLYRRFVQAAGTISQRRLAQKLGGYGILKKRMEELAETLMDAGEIRRRAAGPRGGIWVEWIGRRRVVPPDEEGGEK